MELFTHPHRRLNILTGEWILVSPQRTKRPWQGKIEKPADDQRQAYEASCYLCPGNQRANGETNPSYESTFVFTNDFSALTPDAPDAAYVRQDLLVAKSETGICRVVCFSPRHDLSLAEMNLDEIANLIEVWTKEYNELAAVPGINHVQIFENKGELMGCSNPHPHGQIWAQRSIPTEPVKEIFHMEEHLRRRHSCLLCDYLEIESKEQERLVFKNDDFIVVVPFWAVWPFETMLIPTRHLSCLSDLTTGEKTSYADAIQRIATKYDNLFEVSFPYSAGLHQLPADGRHYPGFHFHMHFYPPLLRSATIKKFMVGYEMLANPQRDVTPEASAGQLRNAAKVHYRFRGQKTCI